MKVLMVLTSHDQLGNTGRKTGFWLEEFAAPYFVFRDAGVDLTLTRPIANLLNLLAKVRPAATFRKTHHGIQ